jgi:hypothetical protein
MNSPTFQTIQSSAPEALYDHVERALLVLTHASLDDDALPGECVDEFEIDFLVGASTPPAFGARN